jgi:hypothetical protein
MMNRFLSAGSPTAGAIIMLSLCLVLASASRLLAADEKGVLLIATDSPCALLVDDVVVRRLDPGLAEALELEPG